MNTRYRRAAQLAALTALAAILSYVEAMIPMPFPVAGMKCGLANVAVLFTWQRMGKGQAVVVSVARVLLLFLLFGNPVSLLFSIGGAACSLLTMLALERTHLFSCAGLSAAGGAAHNIGQVAVACAVTGVRQIAAVLPALVLFGTLCGIATGMLASVLVRRLPKHQL